MQDSYLGSLLNPEEFKKIEKLSISFTMEQIDKTLSELMLREINLFNNDHFSEVCEEKEHVLLNISTLFTASMEESDIKLKNIELLLKKEDIEEIELISTSLTPEQMKETLSELTHRELSLLDDDRFSKDNEMREITLWNISTNYSDLVTLASANRYQEFYRKAEQLRLETENNQD